MLAETLRQLLAPVLVVATAAAPIAPLANAQDTPSASGRIAGVVVDRTTGESVSGAMVSAKLITENRSFDSQRTDALGGYLIPNVPGGIYAVTIRHQGTSYRVDDHFDLRMSMDFLLEACFSIHPPTRTASVRADCASGLYPERQVVSVGAHRYFRPEAPLAGSAATTSSTHQGLSLAHDGLSCSEGAGHLVIEANVLPAEAVVSAKVFFRASSSPNFYYVDMLDVGTGFEAVLPMTAPETTEFVYYVEAVDNASERVQTEEFTVQVRQPCDDPAAFYYQGTDPGIVVGSSMPGVPMTPAGFLPAGTTAFVSASGSIVPIGGAAAATTAAGGGLGTKGLVIIISAIAGTVTTLALVVPQQASPVN